MATAMATTRSGKANDSEQLSRSYSSYNIFFILERFRLLERNGWIDHQIQSQMLTGYEDLELPPLPPKYKHLETTLPNGWYMPGKKKQTKRKHKKTHGCEYFMTMFCLLQLCNTNTTGSSHHMHNLSLVPHTFYSLHTKWHLSRSWQK